MTMNQMVTENIHPEIVIFTYHPNLMNQCIRSAWRGLILDEYSKLSNLMAPTFLNLNRQYDMMTILYNTMPLNLSTPACLKMKKAFTRMIILETIAELKPTRKKVYLKMPITTWIKREEKSATLTNTKEQYQMV